MGAACKACVREIGVSKSYWHLFSITYSNHWPLHFLSSAGSPEIAGLLDDGLSLC